MKDSTYLIPKSNLEALAEKISKLNRKGGNFELSIGNEVIQKVTYTIDGEDRELATPFTEVKLVGEVPVLEGGWIFRAVLDKFEETNLVRTAPDYTLPVELREVQNRCDHCNTNRQRNKLFVLESETGEIKVIGSTCVKDYLGHASAETLIEQAKTLCRIIDTLGDAEEPEFGGSSGPHYIELVPFLAIVAEIVNTTGYQKADSDLPTGEGALNALCNPRSEIKGNEEAAKAAIEWAANLNADSDYLHNIKAIAKVEFFPFKMVNFAASIIPSYYRAKIRAEEQAIADKDKVAVPDTGKREAITGTVISFKTYESDYGYTTKMLVQDDRGFRVFGTVPASINDVEVGDKVTFVAKLDPKEVGFGFYSRPSKASIIAYHSEKEEGEV